MLGVNRRLSGTDPSTMPEAAVYEERLVLYADVLGWRAGGS